MLGDLDTVEHVLVLDGADGERPSLGFAGERGYEELVERSAPMTGWPDLDEDQTAGICYTSATTGNPKGVAYSHRALYLHSLVVGLVDTAAISERDVLLPIVPMFHVNAWDAVRGHLVRRRPGLRRPRPDPGRLPAADPRGGGDRVGRGADGLAQASSSCWSRTAATSARCSGSSAAGRRPRCR